jgi:predicted enzyme related to lactoylglutathione lyase
MTDARPVVRWQILSPDPDATARFYRALFGWRVSQDNALGYREVAAADGGVGGGIWPTPAGVPPFVQLFTAVPDVAACVAEAERLGATVLVPPSALPDGDVMAVLKDPSGLAFAVCTLK